MVNSRKRKGTGFENDATDLLNELLDNSKFKRVVGSGAIGTISGEPLLMGDVQGEIKAYPKKFRIECKFGYSRGEKQFTLLKEWMDKIAEEAKQTYSLPFLMGKFENVRKGTKVFVVLDVNVFAEIMNSYTDLKHELDLVYEKLEKNESN